MAPALTGLGTIFATLSLTLPSGAAVKSSAQQHSGAGHAGAIARQAGRGERRGVTAAGRRRQGHAASRQGRRRRSAHAPAHRRGRPRAARRHHRHGRRHVRRGAAARRHPHAGGPAGRRGPRHNSKGAALTRRRSTRGHRSSDGGCPGEALRPTEANLEAVRSATLCLVDRERALHGERALQLNGRLQSAAQSHTQSMVSDDYFGHYGPSGQTPLQRMRAVGYIHGAGIGYQVGENIAWGSRYLATPKAIVAAWMRSPEHRANILDAHYRDTAIGVVAKLPASVSQGQPGAIYTQDFGVIIHG